MLINSAKVIARIAGFCSLKIALVRFSVALPPQREDES